MYLHPLMRLRGRGSPAESSNGTCVYIGATGPDTKAIPGRQIPARFVSQIRNLKLLEPGEQIQYFYSDALFNIEEGFYLLTDRKVVIYSRNLDDPSVLIPFSDIADLQFDASDNWVDDSQITLELTDGSYASFPVSAQGGGDQNMYAALKKRWEAQRSP